ncbi:MULTISPECIES: effector-associated constant component EACC1 [unclassified Streptomyces]|uniref:effector-associated constant component EACC1 n=1 Tax=unclassified Streptomyces TaxID=2593676 RepID=UPI003D8D1836
MAGEHAADELRSLREWLVAEEPLRGRVRLAAGAPEEGTLGTGMDAVAVALGNGGAFTVFPTVAVTWLKRRTGRTAVNRQEALGPGGGQNSRLPPAMRRLTNDAAPHASCPPWQQAERVSAGGRPAPESP